MTIRCTARVVSEAVVLSLLLSVCSAEAPAINDGVLKSLSLPGVREPRVMRLEDLGDYWQRQFSRRTDSLSSSQAISMVTVSSTTS
jgi:hypothetical protein